MTQRLFVVERLVNVGPSRQWFVVYDEATDQRWLAAVFSERVEDPVMLKDEVRVWTHAMLPPRAICPVDVVRLGGRWCQLYPPHEWMPVGALPALPASVALHLVTEAAAVWLHLHQGTNDAGRSQQLAHGNLHPNNLFVNPEGHVFVGDPDLSLWRSAAWGDQHPVPSPEPRGQLSGDVYALASMLDGWLGAQHKTPQLVGILRRCMAPEPERRPSLSQLASALVALQGRVPGPHPDQWLATQFRVPKPPKKPGFLRLTVGLGYQESPDYADEADLSLDVGISRAPARAQAGVSWGGLGLLMVMLPMLVLMGSGLFARFIGSDLDRATAERQDLEQQLWSKLSTSGARSLVIRKKGDIGAWDRAIETRSLTTLLQITQAIEARGQAKGIKSRPGSLLASATTIGERYLQVDGDVRQVCERGATSLLAMAGLLSCPPLVPATPKDE